MDMDSDDKTTTGRQRFPSSDSKVLYRAAAQGPHPVSDDRATELTQEESLPSRAAGDVWKLIKTVLKWPVILYPVWKWILLIYIGWVIMTHLVAYMYRSVIVTLAPICSIPILGSRIQFCAVISDIDNRALDVSTVATTQDGLTVVLDRVGQNFDLARDMVDHEFAVRDLRIRVAASELSRRKELTQELDSLIRYTKQTAK